MKPRCVLFSETDVDLKSAVRPKREDACGEAHDRRDEPDHNDLAR